jgi:hypothetical protein
LIGEVASAEGIAAYVAEALRCGGFK